MNSGLSDIFYWSEWFLIRPLLAICICFAAIQLTRRIPPEFICNLLTLLLGLLLAYPIVHSVLPTPILPILPTEFHISERPLSITPGTYTTGILFGIFSTIAILGTLAGLIRLAIDIAALRKLTNRAQLLQDRNLLARIRQLSSTLGLRKPPTCKLGTEIECPQVWGIRFPVLLLPDNFTEWDRNQQVLALRHELTHLISRDWIRLIAARVTLALYWFVPGIRWLYKQFCLQLELAADRAALSDQEERHQYAMLLLGLAKRRIAQPVAALVGRSSLDCRVRWILFGSLEATPKVRQLPIALLTCALVLLLLTVQFAPGRILFKAETQENAFTFNWIKPDTAKSESLLTQPGELPDRTWYSTYSAPPTADLFPEEHRESDKGFRLYSEHLDFETIDTVIPEQSSTSFQSFSLRTSSTPEYPPLAARLNQEGVVEVSFTISEAGDVQSPSIIYASNPGYFEQVTLRAIRKFKYDPMIVNGQAVAVSDVRNRFVYQMSPTTKSKR